MGKLDDIRALGGGEMARRFTVGAKKQPEVAQSYASLALELAAAEAEIAKLRRDLKKALASVGSTPVVSTPRSVVSTCPVCEARRQARTAAQKRWRDNATKASQRREP